MEGKNNKSSLGIFTNGILKENPVFVLALGTCPTMAVTTSAINGLGMGLAVMFVLLISNIAISLMKKIIPDSVRIPCYIVIIAGIASCIHMVVQAYFPEINDALGIYLSLIVVNCIVLGRAEAFASKNTVFHSILDALGMGIGFTLALFLIASIRELFGAGTWMGFDILGSINSDFNSNIKPFELLVKSPGGFFVYGIGMAIAIYISKRFGIERDGSCSGCANCNACSEGV